MRETAEEDPYEKVVEVAGKIGVTIKRDDISVCHRLASRSGIRPIIVKFVRRETKFQIMKHKKSLKNSTEPLYINDDLTPLRARIAKAIRNKNDVKFCTYYNEKLFVVFNDDAKVTFNNLLDVYKWDNALVMSACQKSLNL